MVEGNGIYFYDKRLTVYNGRYEWNLDQDYSNPITVGDTIGLLLIFTDPKNNKQLKPKQGQVSGKNSGAEAPRIRLIYYLNGLCLGLAYDILKSYFPQGLYPCIQSKERCTFSITKILDKEKIPGPNERKRLELSSLVGEWLLDRKVFPKDLHWNFFWSK